MMISCYLTQIKYRVAELYEYALAPEHLGSPDPNIIHTTITDTGALAAYSGLKTGRTPKEKRVVLDEITKDVSDNIFKWSDPLIVNLVG